MPEATREEFEQYEDFMAKKQGKQKKKKRAHGRAAASEQRGVSPSKELPEEPDMKRRRRHWRSGLSDDSAGSVQRSPTAGEQATAGRTVRSGAGKAPTPFAHTAYAVVSLAVSALTVAALRLLHVTTEVGTAVVEKLGESMICVLVGLEQAALAASSALEAWFDAVGRVAPYAVGAAVALALHWAYSWIAEFKCGSEARRAVQLLQEGRRQVGQAGRDSCPSGGHHLGASLPRARSTKQSAVRSAAVAPVTAEGALALPSGPPVDFAALKERARRLATAPAAPAEGTALVERSAPAALREEAEYRTASRTVAEAAALLSAKLAMGLGTVTHLMEAS